MTACVHLVMDRAILKKKKKKKKRHSFVLILLRTLRFFQDWPVSLCIPKRSCKVVEMLPCEMCNAFVVSSTLVRLSEYTRSRTLLHISSSLASDGRPDLVSSSKDVLLCLNTPTQNLTCIRWCRRPINIGQLAMYFLTYFPFQIQVPNFSTVLNV